MSPTRRARWFGRWPMAVWLTIVWVLLWGDLTVANVLAGAVIALVVIRYTPMPKVGFEGRVWIPGVVVLAARFAVDVVRASLQVAVLALRSEPPRGAVLRVPLRSHSDLFLTLTAELCSLVPGSIIVEAHRLTGTVYVHILDVERAGGIEAAKLHVLEQEKRVLHALATDAEIEAAGVAPRPGRRRRIREGAA